MKYRKRLILQTEELFVEKQKQLRTFTDFDEILTSLVEKNFNEMWGNKMNKKYRLTYTLYTELGKRTCVETFGYFDTVLQVLRNLNNNCKIDNIKIEVVEWLEF